MEPIPNNTKHLTKKEQVNSYRRRISVGCSIFLLMLGSIQAAPITQTNEVIATNMQSYLTKVDKYNVKPHGRSKRYVLQSKWSTHAFTYRIHNFPQNLSEDIVEKEIARAFDAWSKVANLKFTRESNGSADINIGFFVGSHGDVEPFDGREGLIAHAFFPHQRRKGTVHFDAEEYWTSQTDFGINLFQVAVHEFGHTLGLGHSDVCPSVMWPSYGKYNPNFKLVDDDIRAIQSLYGTQNVWPHPHTLWYT